MDIIKLIKEYGTRIAVVVMALALLLFIPAGFAKSTVSAVLIIVLIVLLLALAVALLLLSRKEHFGDVHFFLYDPEAKKSMSRGALNEKMLRSRLSLYLRPFGRSALSLWDGLPKELRVELSVEPQFRPVVAYGMLMAISDCPDRHVIKVFSQADPRVVSYICNTLKEAGDVKLAEYIYHLKTNESENEALVSPFFKKNGPRFSSRALAYIQRNYDKFYVEKSYFAK